MAAAALRKTANATLSTISSTSAELKAQAINLPQMYSKYVAANARSVSQIESALRSLTYLLPGARLHDSELASESLHTFIQLLSIYHDNLLRGRTAITNTSQTILQSDVQRLPTTKFSLHARYTMFWSNTSSLYGRVATLLKIAQYTELLWEMLARRRGGEKTRWRIVVMLEGFKAICRLILLRLTNSRPLVNPPMPSREDFVPVESETDFMEEFSDEGLKMAMEQESFNPKIALGEIGIPTPPVSEPEKVVQAPVTFLDRFKMPRTGLTLSSMPSPEAISAYLMQHVITPDDVKPAKQLLQRLASLQGRAAEVLYILRPLIYVLLMQRVARRYGYVGSKWKNDWTPWFVGITIEYLAGQLAKRDLAARVLGGARTGVSNLEREELQKRGWNMAWWGIRGSFYENITKKWVHGVAVSLKGKPLLDLVGGVIEDYEYLWSTYHAPTATM